MRNGTFSERQRSDEAEVSGVVRHDTRTPSQIDLGLLFMPLRPWWYRNRLAFEMMGAVVKELDVPIGHEAVAKTALEGRGLLSFSYEVPIESAPATRSHHEAGDVVSVADVDRRLEGRCSGVSVVRPPRRYVMSFITSRTPEGVAAVCIVSQDGRYESHARS
jgi:hypothetical protein